MTRFDVTTIGEGQLRYSVPAGMSLERSPQFDVRVSGTEANVTSLLSRLGWHCGWMTSLPRSPLGRRIALEYGMSGLDMSATVWSDKYRVATYYVEFGLSPKGSHVYYDRENTCFVNLTSDDIDWDYLLDTRLLHITGLTVPLSPSVHRIVLEAVQRARQRGIIVSFDMNYRSRIWTPQQAAEAITPILQHIDVLFFSRTDAHTIYGIEGDPESIVRQLGEMTEAPHIVVSLSKDGVIGWDRETFYFEPAREITVLDRIGAGDAMVAGVLHGVLQGDMSKGVRYGVVTAALALTHYGDAVYITAGELEELITSHTTEIVR